ncbi:MAG: DUF3108 domain-containing protein [Duncaniella sp.]|nr:DUF3108 domain-containing protein [Duncaniella sp.]
MNRKIISILLLILGITPALVAQTETQAALVNETLTYDVIYKWGFINKVAGYASMSLRDEGNFYKATVYAENAPWANSIYMLRDTLYTTFTKNGLYPIEYTYIAHEAGKYKKDILEFTHTGNTFTANIQRYKQSAPGAPIVKSTNHLEAQGMTVDMLSAFFYLRSIDFDKMKSGQSVTVNIFSGSKKEKLKMTYMGISQITLNNRSFKTYYINFTFTRNGKESSDPISGWLSMDSQRIPLKVEGSLAVGKVRAIYTGPNP